MEICATVNHIRYRGDSGWTVVDFVDDTNLRFPGVGPMPDVYEGERLELTGEWTVHKTYGKQFSVAAYKAVTPSSADSIQKYLASGIVKGVGEATAKTLVKYFGEETLNIIENEPDKLQKIPGIGKVRAKMIHDSYMEKREVREIFMGLQDMGLSLNQANRLYGAGVVQRIKDNPYKLIEDVESIGFKTADKIAQNVGFEYDSPFRIKAGLRHTLNMARADGHTCVPHNGLIYRASQDVLGVELAAAEAVLEEMILSSEFIEKHFTLDRTMEGPDQTSSIEPDELKAMVDSIRHIEAALGSGEKVRSESELQNMDIARKSIIAARDIRKGEVFTEENLTVKRPGNGISPKRWFDVLGMEAKRDFMEDELIEL